MDRGAGGAGCRRSRPLSPGGGVVREYLLEQPPALRSRIRFRDKGAVARMERSAIRGPLATERLIPDFAEPVITVRAQLRSSLGAHSRDPLASIRATKKSRPKALRRSGNRHAAAAGDLHHRKPALVRAVGAKSKQA